MTEIPRNIETSERPALNERARAVAADLSENAISPALLGSAVQLAETLILIVAGLTIHALYLQGPFDLSWDYGLPILIGPLVTTFAIRATDGYSVAALRSEIRQTAKSLLAWTLVMAFLAVAGFFMKLGASYSRLWFAAWYLSGIAAFLVGRAIIAHLVRRWTRAGRLERRAVIVGGGSYAEELILALREQDDNDVRICGIFDDRRDDRSPAVVAGLPKLGTIPELVEFARLARIDLLIVSLPMSAENRVLQLLKQLWVLPVDIRLSALGNKLRFRPRSYSYIGAVPFLDLFDRPIGGWNSIVKRAFDVALACLALVLLSPVMIGTAIAIRLDSPGPIFFRQKRYGFNNEVIDVLKFRSMYHHLSDPAAKVAVTKGDARVTRVGRFIRRSSIDELPQLFNVLRGELSLVGPRPHAVNAHTANQLWDEVVDGYFARHKVKPGVTGWAQVNGWRGEVDTPEKIRRRVECDLDYIENWSVFLDLYILMLTPFRLLRSEGAY